MIYQVLHSTNKEDIGKEIMIYVTNPTLGIELKLSITEANRLANDLQKNIDTVLKRKGCDSP